MSRIQFAAAALVMLAVEVAFAATVTAPFWFRLIR